MKKYIGLSLLLVALALLLLFLMPYVRVRPSSEASGVEINIAHVRASTSTYAVDAAYPQFFAASKGSQAALDAINAHIASTTLSAITQFESMPSNPPGSATPQNSFTGDFDKVYVGPDIVSLELVLSQYTGGAHGITDLVGENFDRATGSPLTLADALKLTGLTLQQVSAGATKQLAATLGTDFIFPDGAAPDPSNFDTFVVTPDQVVFIFQEYQVGPYSVGVQEARFPRVK